MSIILQTIMASMAPQESCGNEVASIRWGHIGRRMAKSHEMRWLMHPLQQHNNQNHLPCILGLSTHQHSLGQIQHTSGDDLSQPTHKLARNITWLNQPRTQQHRRSNKRHQCYTKHLLDAIAYSYSIEHLV